MFLIFIRITVWQVEVLYCLNTVGIVIADSKTVITINVGPQTGPYFR